MVAQRYYYSEIIKDFLFRDANEIFRKQRTSGILSRHIR